VFDENSFTAIKAGKTGEDSLHTDSQVLQAATSVSGDTAKWQEDGSHMYAEDEDEEQLGPHKEPTKEGDVSRATLGQNLASGRISKVQSEAEDADELEIKAKSEKAEEERKYDDGGERESVSREQASEYTGTDGYVYRETTGLAPKEIVGKGDTVDGRNIIDGPRTRSGGSVQQVYEPVETAWADMNDSEDSCNCLVEVALVMKEVKAEQAKALPLEPRTVKEALDKSNPECEQWRAALEAELGQLWDNETWEPVPRRPGMRTLPLKVVFKRKYKADGTIEKYKARVVALGCRQRAGIDYSETFSPVVKMKSIKTILAVSAKEDLELRQADVPAAFMNAHITEDLYVEQIAGYERGAAGSVLRVNKALYGMKQAPREWNKEYDGTLRGLGFRATVSDPCVYVKRSKTGKRIYIAVWVDDSLLAYDKADRAEFEVYAEQLKRKYQIKVIPECEWLLQMKVVRNRKAGTITLDQSQYLKGVLVKHGLEMETTRTVDNPVLYQDLCKDDADIGISEQEVAEYGTIVGEVLYAATITRPDLAYAVSLLARYRDKPGKRHLEAAKHLLRYIAGTSDHKLVFGASTGKAKPVEAFCDASWASDVDERKSVSGAVVLLYGSVVSWFSKKQKTVALSTAEAEYMALGLVVQEVKWYTKFVEELVGERPKGKDVVVYCDNTAAIEIAKNDKHHDRTKHIDIRYHFVREEVSEGRLTLQWIRTEDQLADILTKLLKPTPFKKLKESLLEC
jgi:hypothetical protein